MASLGLTCLAPAAPARADDPPAVALTVRDGKLSLDAHEVPLQAILDEIGDLTGVRVHVDERGGAALGDELVTVELRDVPVEEALRLLLRGRDLVFVYSPSRLAEARVYGGDRSAAPGPPPAASVGSDPAAEHPDAAARWRALEALAASGDRARTRDAALAMLERESDPALLQRALDLVLALTSPAPEVRIKALTHLGDDAERDPRARQALEVAAAGDSTPRVREAARALLGRLTPR